jgi:hypothetical protein
MERTTEVSTADPGLAAAADADHPAADARSLPIPRLDAAASRPGATPFAARFQAILIAVMFVGFALIAQRWSKTLYQIGLPLLILAAFFQIAFGNISPTAGFAKSMRQLALTWVLVAAVFGLGIVLAPILIGFGR